MALSHCYVLAIDPGPVESALAVFDVLAGRFQAYQMSNAAVREYLADWARQVQPSKTRVLVIEKVVSYGKNVGADVFQTCVEAGRFAQRWADLGQTEAEWLARPDVKLAICGVRNATDRDIRAELIRRYGPVGKKSEPGIFFGVKADMWAALAVGYAWMDLHFTAAEYTARRLKELNIVPVMGSVHE